MSVSVVLTAEAEGDLDEAAQQYEQRAAGLGVDFVARVRDMVRKLLPEGDFCSDAVATVPLIASRKPIAARVRTRRFTRSPARR